MHIPWEQIDPDTLDNIIKEFILREGTDYGTHEFTLEEKIDQVKQQVKSGQSVIEYSELHESINIKQLK